MKIVLILPKISLKIKLNLSRSVIFHIKTRVNLKFFVNDCISKHSFACNLPEILSNSFNLKLEQLSFKKVLKIVLLGKCLSDLFTDVEICYQNIFKFVLGRFLQRESKF